MNLIKKGYINIINDLKSLEKCWDGYSGKPIKKSVLDRFCDMSKMLEYTRMFKSVGFQENDIEVVPTPEGNIQLEAQSDDVYLEIEIK